MSPRARRQQGRLGARSWPPRAHKFPVTFNLGKESTGILKSVKIELLGYYKKTLRAQKQRTPNQFRWVCDHVREFDLSFYIPIDVMNMPGHKIRHVVIMVNGLNEIAHLHYGHYDRIGAALAVRGRGMGAILCPSPFHLNRTPYFDARFQKNYERYRNAHRPDCCANLDYDRLKECRREPGADTVSRTPHKSMLRRNDCIFHFSEQTANELAMLCKFLRKIPVPPGLFDPDDEAFYDRFFARGEDFSVSLLGYSLGGLQALYAFLREPSLFNRCILLNSGASINKLSPNPVGIGDDEWDAIKNSAYSVNIRKSIGNWEILEDVLLHRPFDTTAAKNSFIHNSERLLFVAGGADLVSSSELLAQFVQHDQGGFGGLNLLQIAGWDHPLRNSPVYDHWFPVIMDLIENFLAHPDGKTVSFDQVVSGLLEFEIKGQQWDRWVIKRRRWYISPDDQNVRLKAFVDLVSHPQGRDDFLSLYMASKRYFQSDAELMRYLQGRREE